MKPLLQLNLQRDEKKAEEVNPPTPESKEQESVESKEKEQEALETDKRLRRIAANAAHKAATEYGRSRSNLFTK